MSVHRLLRLGALAVACAVLIVSMVLAGMSPRPVPIAALAAALAGTYWMTTAIADDISPARWTRRPVGTTRRGHDARVDQIEWRLRARPDRTGPDVDSIVPLLIELLDERVSSAHGIDRAGHPAEYARIVGPDLARFVAAPPDRAKARDPQFLDAVLTRIEAV